MSLVASEKQMLSYMVDELLLSTEQVKNGYLLPDTDTTAEAANHLFDLFVQKGLTDETFRPGHELAVRTTINHERDHTKAAELLGGINIKYALVLEKIKESLAPVWNLATVWEPTRPLVAVELAAVLLHPLVPSEDDIEDIRQTYDSVASAIGAILLHNEKHPEQALPVPRSYTIGIPPEAFDE
jgi:hypothetical protein